ncbi:unnamed protein product [Aureobasidium uvarum]|uniref:Uncharacterized protein n=1 Tax=Aureobasidium uvarum TaxID=2773716 RepID=A0A9N8KGM5_9PEZI|nr:unnamed protein product [Aureobasidium uvarum]
MDFDDELITKLHAPKQRTPTPTPPLPTALPPTTSISDPTATPSFPRPAATPKDGESYYIKPIPSGLQKDVANELQKWKQMKKIEGAEQGGIEQGEQEEEMADVEEDEVQVQLPAQTNHQHLQQQMQQPQPPQLQQPQQQPQHLFAPGVPAYWSATAGHNF